MPQDLARWSVVIPEDQPDRLTVDQPDTSLVMAWERKLKNKQKNEARKRRYEREEDHIQRPRVRASTSAAAIPATIFIQLPTSSTNSDGALIDFRSPRLEAELVARGHSDSRRSVTPSYSYGVTVTPATSASE